MLPYVFEGVCPLRKAWIKGKENYQYRIVIRYFSQGFDWDDWRSLRFTRVFVARQSSEKSNGESVRIRVSQLHTSTRPKEFGFEMELEANLRVSEVRELRAQGYDEIDLILAIDEERSVSIGGPQ